MIYLLVSLAFAQDADGDGVSAKTDCNDADATVYPRAPELCDGQDNDCDGVVPDNEIDGDGDGYVVCGPSAVDCAYYVEHDAANAVWSTTWMLVDKSGNMVDNNGDPVFGGCDCNDDAKDTDAATQSPGNSEVCEALGVQLDSDCDGDANTSNGVPVTGSSVYYKDKDLDGFGWADDFASFCNQPEGYSANKEDCYDLDPSINPLADESCNDRDDDCDGSIDNDDYHDLGVNSGCIDAYLDGDRDEWTGDESLCLCDDGDDDLTVELGSEVYYWEISDPLDCHDANDTIYPGATEELTGYDEDCDGSVAVAEADCDEDGFRAIEPSDTCSGNEVVTCWDGSDYTAVCDSGTGLLFIELGAREDGANAPEDCDDLDEDIYPGASEIEDDGVDQDCDGEDLLPASDSDPHTGDTGPGDDDEKGCDCSTNGGSMAGLWLLGLVGLFWRRRRS